MPPFKQNPSSVSNQEEQVKIEKEKFDITTFNPSLYTRIEDMPEEARGYFMPISKHEGGGYRPNRRYEEVMYEIGQDYWNNGQWERGFRKDITDNLWNNEGEFSEGYKYHLESFFNGSYVSSLTSDEIEDLKKGICLEDQEHMEAALKAWELFIKEHKFSGDEVGFTHNGSYGISVCWRPDGNDEKYRPRWSKNDEINQLPTAEERYRAFLQWHRDMKYSKGSPYVEEKFDDGSLFKTTRPNGLPSGRFYLGKREVAGYEDEFKRDARYFVTLPNGESGRVFESTYNEYLKALEAITLEIKGK